MRLWIRDPLAIMAQSARGGIVVEDGRITELVPSGGRPENHDGIFDASRHVVLPGLINTHHHFYQTLTRANPAAINKELFPWLKALYPIWAGLTPEALRLATRLALTELMMSGCTTASDHQYVFPRGLEHALDIQAEEALALGMRMTLNRGSMNLSIKDGGLPPDSVVQDADTILADCERVIARYHDQSEGAMLQVALAPCSPFSVTKELMAGTAELAKRCGCRLHTHLSETNDEDAFCRATFGCRPVDYLEDVGWLSDNVWLAHGIHFDDGEMQRLGNAGVGVAHCPASNMLLASGQCRTLELEAAGVTVGLGVDGSASNDNSNMMEGVRQALLLNRLRYGAAAVTHHDVLRWATEGSASCLGRSDIGRIAIGMQADLALFTLDELRFSGAGDPLAALVLCGAHRADRVMIKGRWTVEDGIPVGIDVAKLRHEHGAIAKLFAEAA
ncbi:8-oxoguanine deaminase [Phyllobacterium salinisoli]|uniref:8-oxoguanine deaminase n=1 Tax=Phyllobacterium salinisoli TaxID=1899321 RepID=A0A368K732_9HYPH|nr:8-oxoguanine deaminase [Phyllobacterium salinisoli]RCS23870.1 8-oxoguanine deaminase [Phyllobacterium salinisoli]